MRIYIYMSPVYTCSIVSGEQISSPLSIMDRWVRTSDSWKASRPSSSLALLTTGSTDKHVLDFYNSSISILIFLLTLRDTFTDLASWWSELLLQSWTRCSPAVRLLTAAWTCLWSPPLWTPTPSAPPTQRKEWGKRLGAARWCSACTINKFFFSVLCFSLYLNVLLTGRIKTTYHRFYISAPNHRHFSF